MNYFDDLQLRGVDISRVVDYAGGLHEWCTYNILNKSVFKLFKLRNPDEQNITELDSNEIKTLLKNTAHGYKTNIIVDNKKQPLQGLCEFGIELPNLL